jgi:plastocyanin
LAEARVLLKTVLDRVGDDVAVAGKVSEAAPLDAIEDAFATFGPDEIVFSSRWERAGMGLDPGLAGLVRERFAVPVRHLVFERGGGAREPDRDAEARYRCESGDAAARKFAFRSLAGAGILAAVVMSAVALIHTAERDEARASVRAAAEEAAAMPRVAALTRLSVVPEYKRGPEGEKHDAFTTTEFTVHAGRPQELRIDNTDDVPHSITSPEAGVNIVIMPGVHTYTLFVKRPGVYLWFCAFVCDEWAMQHPGYMSGYITARAA